MYQAMLHAVYHVVYITDSIISIMAHTTKYKVKKQHFMCCAIE